MSRVKKILVICAATAGALGAMAAPAAADYQVTGGDEHHSSSGPLGSDEHHSSEARGLTTQG
ncbi:hypothetical protein E0L36_21150 [Streptomyces sp. AJS327]|uniref:hypothetical protein n=1 Tax=Streptomyces sp. AJS327 TaxID=2545265 RepID=UPI0015DD998F|nr:hypothetical protein [Streptomyces sp. AJS327]MBA0053289.1 hypothetical protein [Streptomyces sp. AJS327]